MERTVWNPQVGDGATWSPWTDSYAATVIAVSKSGKQITIQDDQSVIVSGSAQDGSAKYEYRPNPRGPVRKATRRQDGKFRLVGWTAGGYVGPGRRAYQDPSF
jgi:hypothetical protein